MSLLVSFEDNLNRSIAILRQELLRSGVSESVVENALVTAGFVGTVTPTGLQQQNHGSRAQRKKDVPILERFDDAATFDYKLPEGVFVGQKLIVVSPMGKQYEIVVPSGAREGTLLTVKMTKEDAQLQQQQQQQNLKHNFRSNRVAKPGIPQQQQQQQQQQQAPTQGQPLPHQVSEAARLALDEIFNSRIFNNPQILDPVGQMLDPNRFMWWFNSGVRVVGDLFDETGKLASRIYILTGSDAQRTTELEGICRAIPMQWRDAIREEHVRNVAKEKEVQNQTQKRQANTVIGLSAVQQGVHTAGGGGNLDPVFDGEGRKWTTNPMSNGKRGA
jgi:hypothetical protein